MHQNDDEYLILIVFLNIKDGLNMQQGLHLIKIVHELYILYMLSLILGMNILIILFSYTFVNNNKERAFIKKRIKEL